MEIPKNWNKIIFIALNKLGKYKVYLLDHGQELCIINGPIHCDTTFEPLILAKSSHEVRVKAKKGVGEAR